MPQLDKIAFMGQLFWFMGVFASIYILVSFKYLPLLAQAVKLRERVLKRLTAPTSVYRDAFTPKVVRALDVYYRRAASSQDVTKQAFAKQRFSGYRQLVYVNSIQRNGDYEDYQDTVKKGICAALLRQI